MAKYFPEDGIFHSEDAEDMLLRREERHSGMSESLYEKNFYENEGARGESQNESMGVISRLERIDQEYGRKYLRKNNWDDVLNNGEDQYQDKYEFQNESVSPDNEKYYDNMSNYQKSIAKYLDDAHVHLPYQDKMSVRLSMRSERRNRKPNGRHSIMRKSYMRQDGLENRFSMRFNTSRRMEPQRSYFLPQVKDQMAGTGDNLAPTLRPTRGMSDPFLQPNRRDNLNINVGALEDISSKGSHVESRIVTNKRSDEGGSALKPIEEDQSRIHEAKDQENNKEETKDRMIKRKESKKKVNFADDPPQVKEDTLESSRKEESRNQMTEPKTKDKIQEGKPGESESGSGN